MPKKPPRVGEKSARELLSRIGRQFALLFIVIVLFDHLIEWLVEGFHLILELLHLLIEVMEHLAEELLEHLLHTSHHQSETIIFNTVMLLAVFGIFHLFQRWPELSLSWRTRAQTGWQNYKMQKVGAWQRLPRRHKLIVTGAYATGVILILFLLTL
ncbi:MAG: hypothetical protein M0R33_07595 [Methylomonas sp.]|jgi:hypothetical protein|uniref:hypothetical protein n=1 Tax=Methylomonas sp. TaxID=418 RepID=UPI0025F54C10|nr:hypothetical protein [Methylomonas sp.]MCK9606300.1 hypothetical protein [Methylomonas sp.]